MASEFRAGWADVVNGAGGSGDGAAPAGGEKSATPPTMTSALVGGAVLSATGLGFWIWALAIGDDTAARLSDLGSALLGGAVVAFAIFILERQFEQRAAAQDRERERAAERQALRLTLGVQPNLRGVDLSKLDLVRFSFNGKSLENANFSGAKLERATFVGATLAGAQFVKRT